MCMFSLCSFNTYFPLCSDKGIYNVTPSQKYRSFVVCCACLLHLKTMFAIHSSHFVFIKISQSAFLALIVTNVV